MDLLAHTQQVARYVASSSKGDAGRFAEALLFFSINQLIQSFTCFSRSMLCLL